MHVSIDRGNIFERQIKSFSISNFENIFYKLSSSSK